LQNELIYETYEQGEYNQFYVYEPKKRLVMALPFRDRVVQWAIHLQVFPIFDNIFYEHSCACRENKGTHYAADQLRHWMRKLDRQPGETYFLKADVAKYFYRIDHRVLFEIIKRKIDCKDTLKLIWRIIKSDDGEFGIHLGDHHFEEGKIKGIGIPIGNLTSQMFANIYLDFLDKFVKHTLRAKHYIRYMDDFIILGKSKKELHTIRQEIEIFLADYLKLELNNKTTVDNIWNGIDFCGYVTYPPYRKLRKSTKNKMKSRLKYLQRKYYEGEVDINDINASVQSYMGILDHCSSYNLKKRTIGKLDKEILDQLDLEEELELKS
jgi:retron-type reverse transcriptase